MSGRAPAGRLDAGLLERFRSAGAQIEWSPLPAKKGRPGTSRQAHLFQEEARVETVETREGVRVTTDSGPLGALVLILEFEERGRPAQLVCQNHGRDPAFPGGTLVALWGGAELPPSDGPVAMADLVDLARYALA